MADREHLESIGRDDFVDEGAESIEVKTIRSGRRGLGDPQGAPRELEPEVVSAPDGRLGWRVKLPGLHALATPAVVDGRVFVGGGFGSYGFYCFEAESGRLLWKLKTKDDGPTAATVAGTASPSTRRAVPFTSSRRRAARYCGMSGWEIP